MTCQIVSNQIISNQVILTQFPAPPFKTFQVTDTEKLKSIYKNIEKQEEDEDDKNGGKAILCRVCKNKITSSSNRIEKNGSYKHIFNNPGGYIFEIGCFGAAPGCVNQGLPSLEFSWFAGFSWRFSLCAGCHSPPGMDISVSGRSGYRKQRFFRFDS